MGNLKKVSSIIKQSNIAKWSVISTAYIWFSFWHYMFYFCNIKNNKIVISNFYGKGYGDNPKRIVEAILKINANVDIVWLVNDNYSFPKNIRTVKLFSIKSVFELLTAKVWIDNCRKYFFYNIFKKDKTIYFQTWHGDIAMKRIEQKAENNLSRSYVMSAKHDSKMINYFISGSKWMTEKIENDFWYNGEILEYGCPRNDIFYTNLDLRRKVFDKYNITPETKIILFAPTFRKNNKLNKFINFQKLINSLTDRYGGKWKVFLRLHPNIRELKIEESDNVINVSFYEDTQELLCAVDVLITDYSSIMFDMLFLNRPVFLYASDVKDYTKDRNFNFQFAELPFLLAENEEELKQNIKNFDETIYIEKLNKFKDALGLVENEQASIKLAKKILKIIGE